MRRPSAILLLLVFGFLAQEVQSDQRAHRPPQQSHARLNPQNPQRFRSDPSPSVQCGDTHPTCGFWAQSGECQKNGAWMEPNCARSCNKCQLPQSGSVVVPFASTKPESSTPSETSDSSSAPVSNDNSASNKIPSVEALCPRGVQVQEIQTRAVPTAEQYRKVAQMQGCAIPNEPNQCDKNVCFHARYRTADGSCNHLDDSLKGAAYMPFLRMLNANFEDGLNKMVGSEPGTRPPPRILTRFLMTSARSIPTQSSSMVTAFGQFLMHDLMRNTLVNTCKCNTQGAHCANIALAPGDRRPTQCISFTRSIPLCGSGRNGRPRLAMNENTPLMDLSQVYSSDPTSANRLRAGPFLASSQTRIGMLPPQSGTNIVTGDDRADLFAGMTALHAVFLRFHNRIVNALQRINPRWNPDRLYQEARKINGAIAQSVAYNQFLPAILGPRMSLLGEYNGFEDKVDPQISHEFASAGARLHGVVQEVYPLVDSNFRTVGQYRFVEAVASTRRLFSSGVDPIMRGLIITPCKKVGRLGISVTELLFGGETDMLAVNVQRGRDYGVKNYMAYRDLCGLGNFTFEDWKEVTDPKVRQRVSELYKSPDQVDLYIGGLLENPVEGAILGPTLSCIFAEQMKRSRDGDRFFYKNPGIFTEAQRNSIDRVTLSRVLCEIGDSFTMIPQNVFRVGSAQTAVRCDSLPALDLSLWRDQ
ncbi:ShKT domain-containing protein [Aphelenchoides bicaudatus]|nr:ShKT domain-containing protein [Aphelenchoides bicaudatus]